MISLSNAFTRINMGLLKTKLYMIVWLGLLNIYIYISMQIFWCPCIILKLDFEKDFDTIEHDALLQILRCKGFNEEWIRWVSDFLGSGSSSVMMNGVFGKEFNCKRGLGKVIHFLLFYMV
jgi:hypothetical protein